VSLVVWGHCVGGQCWEAGTSASLVGFWITHISMSLCSAIIAPCSCSCFLWRAASMDSSHCLLMCSGWPRWCLRECFISPILILANCPGLMVYICQILLLVSFSRIDSQLCLDSCRALFLWSHMSQATFHSFLMISDVHLWLDLWDISCFQICSCCYLHSMLSHPSQMYCFPICAFLLSRDSCWGVGASGDIHVCRVCMSCSHMCVLVPSKALPKEQTGINKTKNWSKSWSQFLGVGIWLIQSYSNW